MRKVYTPPSTSVSLPTIIAGALVLTLGIFLVLPLTQLISSGLKKDLTLRGIDDTPPPPPPPEVMEAEPPPPPEPEEAEPQPELMEQTQQLSLADLDIDLGAGGPGGFLKGGLASFAEATDGLNNTDLFDMGDLDKAPTPVSAPSPRYPAEMKKQKITGSVMLEFIVNTQGRVENPRVATSTNPAFEEPALAAVRKWRYRPGERNGEPVSAPVRQPFDFKF